MTREDVNYIVSAASGLVAFFVTMPAGFWVRDQIERRLRSGSNAH